MRKTLAILFIFIVLLHFSCKQLSDKSTYSDVAIDTIHNNVEQVNKENLVKRAQIELDYRNDSLRLDKVLKQAFEMANQNIANGRYHNNYDVAPDSILINVDINFDYHFTKSTPHLIIRRSAPSAIYIDIYTKNVNNFEKVLSHEEWIITYVNDTIKDINGDGLKDFVVNGYGSNGCCLKAFSNVYLLHTHKKMFSTGFRFINPTFSLEKAL